jgi:hypothetical protein
MSVDDLLYFISRVASQQEDGGRKGYKNLDTFLLILFNNFYKS